MDTQTIRAEARAEAGQIVDVTLGEYMSHDIPPEDWDLRGLSSWAMSRFQVDLKQNQLRRMSPDEVQTKLVEVAHALIDRKDLDGARKFLVELYAETQLAHWASQKFGVELKPEELAPQQHQKLGEAKGHVAELIVSRAREAYQQREVLYPVQFIVDMTFHAAQIDSDWAAKQLAAWANQRFELGWEPDQIVAMKRETIYEQLVAEAKSWHGNGKLETVVDKAMHEHQVCDELAEWATKRFGQSVQSNELSEEQLRRDVLLKKGRAMLRTELTQLERYVLLQILDTAWKDHLYVMDQLKDSVGLRGYAERDPRIEYKREGANLFGQMQSTVRDRVTDLIFRARLSAEEQQRNVYGQEQAARHSDHGSLLNRAAETASGGTAQQRADLAAADRAGGGGEQQMSRKQRRAASARARSQGKGQHDKQRKRRSR